MTQTVVFVRELAGVDAKGRELKDDAGRPVLDGRRYPEMTHLRLRWRVSDAANFCSVLLDPTKATAARAAYDELAAACRHGTPVGADSWPLGSIRPKLRVTGSSAPAKTALVTAGSARPGGPVAPPGLDPVAAMMTVRGFFEAHVRDSIKETSKGVHVNQQRSAAKILAGLLPRHPSGRELVLYEITTSDLRVAHTARRRIPTGDGDGGDRASSGATMSKFEILARRVFSYAAEMYPPAVVADPWLAIDVALRSAARKRRRRPNQLDPAVAGAGPNDTGRLPSYRDARRQLTFDDIERSRRLMPGPCCGSRSSSRVLQRRVRAGQTRRDGCRAS